jgi:quercetin 2,3-dioxygenase
MSDEPIRAAFRLGFPWQTTDPFLFCVHHDDAYPRGNAKMGPAASLAGRNLGMDFEGKDGWRMYHGEEVPGFPQHPHRGFETVTIVRKGLIDHSDSLGAKARFGGGDVQWLTAGKGIVHSEMFPLLHEDKDNPVELFQIWLNLPRVNKMVEPHFSMLWRDQIPVRVVQDNAGKNTTITVVAGQYGDARAPKPPPHSFASNPASDVAIWTLALEAGATFTLPRAERAEARMLYVFRGAGAVVAGERVPNGVGLELSGSVDLALEAGPEPTEFLLLQGAPINEPVVQHGPFVMNSAQEIQQAFADYQRTRFGGWPFRRDDPVHERNAGRFARRPDGTEEKPAS